MAKKLVLVHGLGGNPKETWSELSTLLEADRDLDFVLISCGYESPNPLSLSFWRRGPSIANIANGVLTEIGARCDLENDEIVLVGHSLGGIVVKKLMLVLHAKKTKHRIKKVCFVDVPHDGSGYANVGRYISLRNMHLRALCRDSSELDSLNDDWVYSGLDEALNVVSIIAANDEVVSSSSSKSIFRNHKVETINGVNHRSIVKPESSNSPMYLVLKRFLLQDVTVTFFKNKASREFDDWVHFEGIHEYQYVADEQRDQDFQALCEAISVDQSVVRITGASGLGKTRLLIEAINASPDVNKADVLIFDGSSAEELVRESVRGAVENNARGMILVENCSVDLHNQLAREIRKTKCALRLATIGHAHEKISGSILIGLSPLSKSAIQQILTPILIGLDEREVERVARFAEGYPLMATLMAQQYTEEGRLLGSIEENSVVRKLIDGDGMMGAEEKAILSACALFDVFGTNEGNTAAEAKFIAVDVAGQTLTVFDRVLSKYSKRQIIKRAGRYARVVPKPLALTLAAEWWEETSYDRQKELVDNIPDSLMQSFCIQASYLDNRPDVQRFSDRLFGGEGPFVQAEALLTERGSKLFRAFVEVNPSSTSKALLGLLDGMSFEELSAIEGNTRRNLVWALEMLCFHASVFEDSAWCLLLLAGAENESWGNNATGTFAQLYQLHLSGTETEPESRFALLERALQVNEPKVDMVVLKALSKAIDTHGETRTLGAEHQGTKAQLKEWRPSIWKEVFDYWSRAFELLLATMERGDDQREVVTNEIGRSIRGFVRLNRLEMLDEAIRKIVEVNGRYWPSALESIKDTFSYESENLNAESKAKLDEWLALIGPDEADLPEKIKILVVGPPWEHRESDTGQFIDVAEENARTFAKEASSNIENLYPCLDLLLSGEQKQSFVFGEQIALELPDVRGLLNLGFEKLLLAEQENPSLLLGIYRGIFKRSPADWQDNIDRLLQDRSLIRLYPEFIRTGAIEKSHLNKLIELIREERVPAESASILSYGRVTDGIESQAMAKFCLELSDLGDDQCWSALNVIYMYCHGNQGAIKEIRESLKQLISRVPINSVGERRRNNAHQWHDLAKKLLKIRDEELVLSLGEQLLSTCRGDSNFSDTWHYFKPLMVDLMRDYHHILWPLVGQAIVAADDADRFRLGVLLGRERSFSEKSGSVISKIPVDDVISWARKHPEIGPRFVAGCINLFETAKEQKRPSKLLIALLENFGDTKGVASELRANMGSRAWSGSLVPYLEEDKAALSLELGHKNRHVSKWLKDQISSIDHRIALEEDRDAEESLGIF